MNVKNALHFLIGLIILFALIPNSTLAASKMPEGTKIADVHIENKKEAEIRKMIDDEIVIWKAQDDILLEGEFDTMFISRDAFHFDVDATLDELKKKTKRSLSTFFKRPKNVHIPLNVQVDESHRDIQHVMEKSYIDYDNMIDKLELTASNLAVDTISLTYIEGEQIPLETVAKVKFEVPELSKATLDYIIDELDGYIIEPEQLFSFLQSIETPEKLLNSRDESSFLGTALYSLFLQADFEIVERHAQLTLPPYGEKGVNAEVNKRENKDLIVFNNSDTSYRLHIDYSNKAIELSLAGNEPLYTYEIKVKNEKEIKRRTLYRYSKKVNPGEQQVVQEGENGLKVDIYRSKFEDGQFVNETLVSKELYLPTPRILLVSPDDPEIEDIEIDLEDDEDIIIDENGELIIGSPNDSIVDLLPDNIKDTDRYEQLVEAERVQQQYEQFLKKLLEIYANSFDTIDEDVLEQILLLKDQIETLEQLMDDLIEELIENGQLDKQFLEKRKDGVD